MHHAESGGFAADPGQRPAAGALVLPRLVPRASRFWGSSSSMSAMCSTAQLRDQERRGKRVSRSSRRSSSRGGCPSSFCSPERGVGLRCAGARRAEFTRERTLRLLVPFFTGTLLLGPIQIYLSWRHRTATGVSRLVPARIRGGALVVRIGPKLFGALGYHMWFLGFLFAFSLLALPLFIWLKGEAGRRLIAAPGRAVRTARRHPALHPPAAVVRLLLQPFFPNRARLGRFLLPYGMFFVLGYRAVRRRAVHRRYPPRLAAPLRRRAGSHAGGDGDADVSPSRSDLRRRPRTFPEFLLWGLIATSGWCWSAFMLFIGMRFLDRNSRALRYGQEVLLPFFVLHQPAIIVVAYFVVQWKATIADQTAGRCPRRICDSHRTHRAAHQAYRPAAHRLRHEGRAPRRHAERERLAQLARKSTQGTSLRGAAAPKQSQAAIGDCFASSLATGLSPSSQ